MVALGTQLGRGFGISVKVTVGLALGASLIGGPAYGQSAPIDPYAPPPPPIVAAPSPPPPAAAPSNGPSISGNGNNQNTNTVSPVITANPTNNNSNTSTNTNTNDNRSNASATATNNNTIYIYPPAVPPPAPPIVPPPSAIAPPPLVPPPAMAGAWQPRRIRLNCAQLCARPPVPLLIPPPAVPRDRFRVFSFGAHVTALGMARQPLVGWGTLGGGGLHLGFRSRGRFGFEMSQDFLKGEFRVDDGGKIVRQSFPVDFTFRGYILPNLDRHVFNLYFGGGFGAMLSSVQLQDIGELNTRQTFLEWTIHGDVGAELRFKAFSVGLDAKIMGIARDRLFGDGRYYGGVGDGVVPASTWGLQGRGYVSLSF